jgi:hypothetical protein
LGRSPRIDFTSLRILSFSIAMKALVTPFCAKS